MAKYTQQEIINALIAAKGMKTLAAKRLGCSYNTVNSYIEKYPNVKAALDESKQSLGDTIESTLLNQALGERDNNGTWKQEPNISALIFLAKTHPAMRERGYGEQIKLDIDIKIIASTIDAIQKMGQDPVLVFNRIIQKAALQDDND